MQEVPDSEENAAACLCANCPSKNQDDRVFYCVRGRSPSPVEHGFCACRWCPLWSGYGLTLDFYCDEGILPLSGKSAEEEAALNDEALWEEGMTD